MDVAVSSMDTKQQSGARGNAVTGWNRPSPRPCVADRNNIVDGARENSHDFLRSLLSAEELTAVTVPFQPSGDGSGHLEARFDIVMS